VNIIVTPIGERYLEITICELRYLFLRAYDGELPESITTEDAVLSVQMFFGIEMCERMLTEKGEVQCKVGCS